MSAAPLKPYTVALKDREGGVGFSRVLAPDPETAIAYALANDVVATADDEGMDAEEALDYADTDLDLEWECQAVIEGHPYNLLYHGLDLRGAEERIEALRDAAVRAVLEDGDEDLRCAIGAGDEFPEAVPA